MLFSQPHAAVLPVSLYVVFAGYTQLRELSGESIATLLPRCLPPSWLGRGKVKWRPGAPGQPPADWLEALWTYLIKHHRRDLSPFEHLPIVPFSGTFLENQCFLVVFGCFFFGE